ncbi:MAG TPA: DNA glycosylase [Feifaniaceae bacterium]|nr:DNA glycosylase [Feifaniaceae bacterium]
MMDTQNGKRMRLPGGVDFETTFFSGQTFSWAHADGGYIGCVENNAAYLDAGSNTLHWAGPADDAYWARYFDLSRDYAAVFSAFQDDVYIRQAYARYGGMRVLNQPLWETLCAFIISANNNIKRITSIMARVRANLGGPLLAGGHTLYAFPDAGKVAGAGEPLLKELGLGYRAAYILHTAQRVQEGFDLSALPRIGYVEAQKALVGLPGVGEKVADCVLLFSCGYTRAFPVDVWVKRVMRVLYGASGSNAAIKAQGCARFGADAGLVQQVLFHGARTGLFPALCEADRLICDS